MLHSLLIVNHRKWMTHHHIDYHYQYHIRTITVKYEIIMINSRWSECVPCSSINSILFSSHGIPILTRNESIHSIPTIGRILQLATGKYLLSIYLYSRIEGELISPLLSLSGGYTKNKSLTVLSQPFSMGDNRLLW